MTEKDGLLIQRMKNSTLKLLVGSLVGIALLVVAISTYFSYLNVQNDSGFPASFAVAIASAVGAIGTLFLAYQTFQSTSQNEEILEEMRKDRKLKEREIELPILNGVIDELLDPSIERLENNLQVLNSGEIGWDKNEGTAIQSVINPSNISPELAEYFKENNEDAYESCELYTEEVDKFEEGIDKIAERVRQIVWYETDPGRFDEFIDLDTYMSGDSDQHGEAVNKAVDDITRLIINRAREFPIPGRRQSPYQILRESGGKRPIIRENRYSQLSEIRRDYRDLTEQFREQTEKTDGLLTDARSDLEEERTRLKAIPYNKDNDPAE